MSRINTIPQTRPQGQITNVAVPEASVAAPAVSTEFAQIQQGLNNLSGLARGIGGVAGGIAAIQRAETAEIRRAEASLDASMRRSLADRRAAQVEVRRKQAEAEKQAKARQDILNAEADEAALVLGPRIFAAMGNQTFTSDMDPSDAAFAAIAPFEPEHLDEDQRKRFRLRLFNEAVGLVMAKQGQFAAANNKRNAGRLAGSGFYFTTKKEAIDAFESMEAIYDGNFDQNAQQKFANQLGLSIATGAIANGSMDQFNLGKGIANDEVSVLMHDIEAKVHRAIEVKETENTRIWLSGVEGAITEVMQGQKLPETFRKEQFDNAEALGVPKSVVNDKMRDFDVKVDQYAKGLAADVVEANKAEAVNRDWLAVVWDQLVAQADGWDEINIPIPTYKDIDGKDQKVFNRETMLKFIYAGYDKHWTDLQSESPQAVIDANQGEGGTIVDKFEDPAAQAQFIVDQRLSHMRSQIRSVAVDEALAADVRSLAARLQSGGFTAQDTQTAQVEGGRTMMDVFQEAKLLNEDQQLTLYGGDGEAASIMQLAMNMSKFGLGDAAAMAQVRDRRLEMSAAQEKLLNINFDDFQDEVVAFLEDKGFDVEDAMAFELAIDWVKTNMTMSGQSSKAVFDKIAEDFEHHIVPVNGAAVSIAGIENLVTKEELNNTLPLVALFWMNKNKEKAKALDAKVEDFTFYRRADDSLVLRFLGNDQHAGTLIVEDSPQLFIGKNVNDVKALTTLMSEDRRLRARAMSRQANQDYNRRLESFKRNGVSMSHTLGTFGTQESQLMSAQVGTFVNLKPRPVAEEPPDFVGSVSGAASEDVISIAKFIESNPKMESPLRRGTITQSVTQLIEERTEVRRRFEASRSQTVPESVTRFERGLPFSP